MKNHIKNLVNNYWLVGLILIIAACQNEADKTPKSFPNKFHDQTLIDIYDFQDKRDTENLLKFFNDDNPKYRAAAAEAFGSVQDSLAIPILSGLLSDENSKVRKAAAYALGQTYDSSAMKPLVMAIDNEDSTFVRREMLEALGKVITQPKLSLLNQLPAESDQEKEGLAWGLYRAGIRNVHDDLSVGTAVVLLSKENSYETRLAAAHFLARTRNIEPKNYLPQIIAAATQDSAANVRMAAMAALAKINTPSALQTIMLRGLNDQDYRVRINAIRALSSFDFNYVAEEIYKALDDENINVAITAADLIKSKSTDTDRILDLADSNKNFRVKSTLYGAALTSAKNKEEISTKIKQAYENATNAYYQAGLLQALSSDLNNYEFIVTKTFDTDHKAISTAGASALVGMRQKESFPEELESAFADILKQLMETNDIAIVAIVSGILSNPDYNFADAYENYDFLYGAKENLELPKDNEALQVLNRTIALFEGKEELPETKNEYNNPIDWELVKTIESDQKVKITTVKGEIILRLLIEEAPGSVANFYTLANDGYFNGKNFHRGVPNFVVQGGCNRGDGYGGENFSIRSEFANIRYQTGSVGMASAGKDTEGTQWFITHSPTPHLDGRYTIFAQVEEGIELVHATEVGDVIKSVEILK